MTFTKEMKELIMQSMLDSTNFWAQKNEMGKATAIHGAYLSLIDKIEKEAK